jgi:hypothetical protein
VYWETANLIAPPDDLSGDEVGEVFSLPDVTGSPFGARLAGRLPSWPGLTTRAV